MNKFNTIIIQIVFNLSVGSVIVACAIWLIDMLFKYSDINWRNIIGFMVLMFLAGVIELIGRRI
jgi:hypothetical protein